MRQSVGSGSPLVWESQDTEPQVLAVLVLIGVTGLGAARGVGFVRGADFGDPAPDLHDVPILEVGPVTDGGRYDGRRLPRHPQ